MGAPLCDRDPVAATSTNLSAIVEMLGHLSREQRVLLPVTNSGYGVGEADKFCTEETPMRPVSLYGRDKVEGERILLDRHPSALSFRLATVFGMSPRMRLDLLVNDFTYRACLDRFIVLFESHFKRNFIHVRDVARAFLHGIDHFDTMKGGPYNVGLSDANLSKLELCQRIQTAPAVVRVRRIERRRGPRQARLHRVEREDRANRLSAGVLARRRHPRADQGVRDDPQHEVLERVRGDSNAFATMLMAPQRRALWVLVVSGLLGFRVGVVGFPSWHVSVETAQVLAGLVTYPPDNPFYIYHTKLWTVIHQICAVVLRLGVSEAALSLFLSGLVGMVSFQALSLFVYALSGEWWLAVGSAFVVFFSRAAEYGVTYPVMLMGTSHTYGELGLSMFVLVVALLGGGWYRTGGILLGLAPAVHPSLGLWLWVTVAAGVLWDFKGLRGEFRPAIRYFLAGAALTMVSLIVQFSIIYDVPQVDPSVSARYLNAFVSYFDEHRQPVRLVSSGTVLNCAAFVLALVWLTGFPRDVPRPAVFLLRVVLAGAVLSLGFTFLSWVPSDRLPQALVILMPGRLLNFNAMSFVPMLFGLLAARRGRLWSSLLTAMLATGLLFSQRSMFWEWVEHREPVWHSRLDQLLVIGAVSAGLLGLAAAALKRRTRNEAVTTRGARMTRAVSLATQGAQLVTVSVLLTAVVLTWRIRGDNRLLDRTNDPFFSEVAADRSGLVATGGGFHLVQLCTRRPVLLDTAALNTLAYAPESGPAMDRILRDVYDIDVFNPPSSMPRGTDVIPVEVPKALWEGFSRDKWQEIRRTYNVTQVVTRAGWELALPLAAQNASFKLYRIPGESGTDGVP